MGSITTMVGDGGPGRPWGFAGVVALVALGCAGTPAAGPAEGPATSGAPAAGVGAAALPPEIAAHVRESELMGRMLYQFDKASAIGTDVVLAHVAKPSDLGIAGWLTFGDAAPGGTPTGGYRVLFLTRDEPPLIPCEVVIAPGQAPSFTRHAPPREATPFLARLFHARQAAINAMPRNGQLINPVVFPAAGRKGILVYLLAGTKQSHELVFGLHYRALVSEDGAQVLELTPLSKGPLVVRESDLPPGAVPLEEVVTHLVTDWPLETHVFVSLMHHRRPITVLTKLGQWRVVGDKIDFLGGAPPPAP